MLENLIHAVKLWDHFAFFGMAERAVLQRAKTRLGFGTSDFEINDDRSEVWLSDMARHKLIAWLEVEKMKDCEADWCIDIKDLAVLSLGKLMSVTKEEDFV